MAAGRNMSDIAFLPTAIASRGAQSQPREAGVCRLWMHLALGLSFIRDPETDNVPSDDQAVVSFFGARRRTQSAPGRAWAVPWYLMAENRQHGAYVTGNRCKRSLTQRIVVLIIGTPTTEDLDIAVDIF